MDLTILDQYGLPIALAIAFGYLIDQQKLTQLDVKQIKGYMEGIENILAKLTGDVTKL